jgi:hypothetical protein
MNPREPLSGSGPSTHVPAAAPDTAADTPTHPDAPTSAGRPVREGADRWVNQPRTWRVLAVLTVAGMFVLVASVNEPRSSQANVTPLFERPSSAPAQLDAGAPPLHTIPLSTKPANAPSAADKPLGELQSVDLRVLVVSTPEGVRYTVTTTDGRTVRERLTLDDFAREFPNFGLDKLRDLPAGESASGKACGALMFADPSREDR